MTVKFNPPIFAAIYYNNKLTILSLIHMLQKVQVDLISIPRRVSGATGGLCPNECIWLKGPEVALEFILISPGRRLYIC